jgi:hypothetical protein
MDGEVLLMTRLLLVVAIGGLASLGFSEAGDAGPVSCVRHWPEVRYGNLGYDHIVLLRNGCRAHALCEVSTNVNPKPIETKVRAGEQVEVLTMRGSPAREFTQHVNCRLVP